MFEIPTKAEVEFHAFESSLEREVDRMVAPRGKDRAIALAVLIGQQMEDDEEWQDLLADAPRSLTRGVMSVDSFDAHLSSLEDAGIEDTRATDKECESDLASFLPVWQEIIRDSVESQIG